MSEPARDDCRRVEISVLLCAARSGNDPDMPACLRALLAEKPDWDYLLEMADTHGMLPLLAKRLQDCCADAIPQATLERLRAGFDRNARRSVLMAVELRKLLDLFGEQGISLVPYKGPAMSVCLYGDLALRRVDDLDVLIHKRDVWQAGALLMGQGFEPEVAISKEQLAAFFRSECDQKFVHAESGLCVELHWEIVPPYFGVRLEMDRFWDRLQSVELVGTQVPVLPAEELLWILCIHGTKHMWERLEWLCAVAQLMNDDQSIDWARLLTRAKESRTERMLLLGLLLAQDSLGAKTTPGVRREIAANPVLRTLAGDVNERLFEKHPPSPLQLTKFRLRLIRTLRERIRYSVLRSLTPTCVDMGAIRVPPGLQFLYYLIRPLRLGGNLLRNMFKQQK